MGPGAASGVAPRFPGDRFDLRRAWTGQSRTRHAGPGNRTGPGPDRPGVAPVDPVISPPRGPGLYSRCYTHAGVTSVVTPRQQGGGDQRAPLDHCPFKRGNGERSHQEPSTGRTGRIGC